MDDRKLDFPALCNTKLREYIEPYKVHTGSISQKKQRFCGDMEEWGNVKKRPKKQCG